MKPGGGGKKGGQFEREVCVKLSRWITRGERNDVFWRTAMSGGRATIMQRRGELVGPQVGDICAVHPTGRPLTSRFAIECKFRQRLELEGLFFPKRSGICRFWIDTCLIAEKTELLPMLIAKQNHRPPLLVLDWEGASVFSVLPFLAHFVEQGAHIALLDVFLTMIRPEILGSPEDLG